MIKPNNVSYPPSLKSVLLLGGILLALAGRHDALAQVSLNLTPAAGSGSAGSSIIYSGQIANLTSASISLNALTFGSISPFSSDIATDDSLFFADVPSTLAANTTYTGDIFSINLGANAAAGTYTSSVAVVYNSGASVTNFQNFLITVTGSGGALPEPSTLPLLMSGAGIAAGVVVRRRRKTRSVAS